MRRGLLVALVPLAFLASACGGQEGESGSSYPTEVVGKVTIEGDTDQTIRQFSFTDLDGVRQKCFLFGGPRGSVSCQPAGER